MSNLSITSKITGVLNSRPLSIGSDTPVSFALSTDEKLEATIVLTNTSSILVWDPTVVTEPISSFSVLSVVSDQDVLLELCCDAGNDVGKKTFVLKVKQNLPFSLHSNYSHANLTEGFDGTADVIDRIRLKNVSGSTANITITLIK
ncbi:hypothetical protein KC887_00300 [Candidatus Kaiserbacteria bacterium]|nr:hypothetical protein [Candidatus Kaiserbacteria bacterium]